ncbi:MAG: tRNA (adenosine(37)-N6)-dimethylallyltransferase MiaA [bacterium]|nr:tRNA (adenosine(37)-N6)-dimethylallyltransferase MiaA [bacterium]
MKYAIASLQHDNRCLFIIGPTATGKTALGIELAKKFDGEIISADSRQVYRGMDIGTGKDLSYPQWGIDLCDPDHEFNVSEFRKYALEKIKEIQTRNKLPIVVGGTGFYVKAILNPWETMDVKPNIKLREKLDKFSVSELQEELKKVDKNKWDVMNDSDRLNPRRLVRAIELAGKIASSQAPRNDTDPMLIGLTAPYDFLYKRIDRRVEERIKNGMNEEKERLIKKYKKLPKTLWGPGEHNYARRQMSFFRNLVKTYKINWLDISTQNVFVEAEMLVAHWKTRKPDSV